MARKNLIRQSKFRFFNNSIFTRLICTFLIVITPIYCLGILMYQWSLRTVKDEISKSATAQATFYLQRLEEEIERMKLLQYDCLNDENLLKLAIRSQVMDEYETMQSMLQLQQRLITIKNSSSYILDVSAHIPIIEKTITANTAVNPFRAQQFENIRAPSDTRGAQIILFQERIYMSTLQETLYSDRRPMYSIQVELDKQAFESALEQFNLYDDSSTYLVGHTNQMMIASQSGESFSNYQDLGLLRGELGRDGAGYSRIQDRKYFYVYVQSDYLDIVLLRYIPQELLLTPIRNFYIWVWAFSTAALLLIIIYSFSTYRLIQKPLLELVNSFRKVKAETWTYPFPWIIRMSLDICTVVFNHMVENLSNLIDQVYKQKILTQRSELKQLQSQINPHFLYNSLFMINTMARIGDDNLIPFTRHLGEYFRFVTKNSEDDTTLREEVGHTRNYTEIQMMRYARRLQVDFEDYPPQYAEMQVPRLIIQPVVENAFQYAVEKQKDNSYIRIAFETTETELRVLVEDSGEGVTDEKLAELRCRLDTDNGHVETTGLLNVNRRLRLIYGESGGLIVERSGFGGMKTTNQDRIEEGEWACTVF